MLDLIFVPEASVLSVEQNELSLRRDARIAPRVLEEKQRVETVRFRLVGHQSREDRCEPDRLTAELAPHGRAVAGVEDEVDRRHCGPQAVGQEVLRWHAQRDACVTDLPLGPDEPLSEGRLGQEEGARDLGCRQAADETQRQRHLCLRGEGGVAAGKDQLEPFVGNDCLLVLRELLGAGKELGLARERLLAADAVDRPVARRGHYPRARIRGDAVTRPSLGGSDEGVLHRVLGEVEVTEDAAEDRDRASALVAVGAAELLYEATSASRMTMGRTSMWP